MIHIHDCRRSALVVAIALSLASCEKSPEQHLLRGQELLARAEYEGAIIELKNVVQQQPDNGVARWLLGQAFSRNGAYRDAEGELVKARDLGAEDEQILPVLADVRLRQNQPAKVLELGIPATGMSPAARAALLTSRAEAQILLGQRADAEQSLAAAWKLDPELPALILVQARLAVFDKQRERAVRLIDDALQRHPQFVDALYFKARLLESEKRVDEAIAVYQQLVTSHPSQFAAYIAIARLQQQKGDLDAAEKAVRQAEQIAPRASIVMFARGILELQRNHPEKASAALSKVLQVAPDHLPSLLAYATASYGLGKYEESIAKAKKALGLAPDNLLAARLLADSQLRSGAAHAAVETLEPWLARHPDNLRLLALAGEAHLRAANYNKAKSYLEQAAAIEPENVSIKATQAEAYQAAGETHRALASLEQAIKLSDKPGQLDLTLISLRLARQQYDQALTDIARIEEKLPPNPLTAELRAAALLGKGDRAGARKSLEQVLAIQPTFVTAAIQLAKLDLEDKDPGGARKRLESVLTRDKENVPAMLALAELAASEQREADYLAWLERAAATDHKAIAPRAELVRHYLRRKQEQSALRYALEASQANPGSLPALRLLATTQLAIGERSAAIATFGVIKRQAPRSPQAHLDLALAQIVDQQLADARQTLLEALQLKPDFQLAQEALLRLELKASNPEAALQIARQMQTQAPQSAYGYDREAEILLSQKRYPPAIKAYEQALARGAGTEGLLKLHRALLAAGEAKSADQRLTEWIRQRPSDLLARAYAGEVYAQTGRQREAIAQYEAILKVKADNVLALSSLARLYQSERDSRAAATAEQALQLAPDNPQAQDALGWILVEQGQLPRALTLLGKATSGSPQATAIRYHYAVALALSGRKAEAKKELAEVIAKSRKSKEVDNARNLLESL